METLEAGQCNRPPQMTVALDSCTIQFLAKEINMQQEITANGVAFLELCKNGVKVKLEVCKLSDGTIMYTPSDGSAVITGSIVDVFAAGYTVECEVVFERCFPFNIVIQDGECITLQEIIDKFPEAKGIAGYDIDLKSLLGDGRDGFKASTSDATMEGPHGEGNLDGGGGFDIKPERLPDNTYNRLDLTQKFCSCEGSVLNLGVSIIL